MIEGGYARCEGLDDRLFERTRNGVSGGRGRGESGVEGADEAHEGLCDIPFEAEKWRQGNNVESHRVELGAKPSAEQLNGIPPGLCEG